MGPTSTAQMGSVLFCPRARCPSKVGIPSIRIYGLLQPIWAANMGPTSTAQMASCSFVRGLHVRPKWEAYESASLMNQLGSRSRFETIIIQVNQNGAIKNAQTVPSVSTKRSLNSHYEN